jgi:phenylpropionate dioxygenase-like ring-hydroxylating dioxygenase large terminal subunit
MRIRNVETKTFLAKFVVRLVAHNLLKDSQVLLPKADYERRYGAFPRYFSGWYLFVPSQDLAPGELVHKKLNGQDLIAFRDNEGHPVIHRNRCPHMDGLFAPLGTVQDGRLVCAYHGYAYDRGVPKSGPASFRGDPSKCIPTHPVREVNGLVMFWFDADTENGVGEPAWELDLPDASRFERQAIMRSITPTHMAPLHENIIDDQHFMQLHGSNRYVSELLPYHQKHRFRTKNTMTVPAPRIGPFRIGPNDEMEIQLDTDFHGLGIHINTVTIGGYEALMIHCTTPIEDEVTEWTLSIYMPKRTWKPGLETLIGLVYPWGSFAQTYFLHTQDRRVFFEKGEYRFFEDVPEGFEKVNAFRRWIHEELMGEQRPMGAHSMPTRFVPRESESQQDRVPGNSPQEASPISTS